MPGCTFISVVFGNAREGRDESRGACSCMRGCVWFPDDDAAVVFQIHPLGVGAAGAVAVPF